MRNRGDEASASSSRLARKGSRETGRGARVSLPPGHGDTLHTGGMSHREAGQQDRKGGLGRRVLEEGVTSDDGDDARDSSDEGGTKPLTWKRQGTAESMCPHLILTNSKRNVLRTPPFTHEAAAPGPTTHGTSSTAGVGRVPGQRGRAVGTGAAGCWQWKGTGAI